MRMPRPLALAPARGRALKAAATTELANQELITDDPNNNVTPYIANLVGRSLHRQPAHPLGIIKSKIEEYFSGIEGVEFSYEDAQEPLVTVTQCFDDLLIAPAHVSRRSSDTYYVSSEQVLRTHTSAHQSQHLRQGHEAFLCTGDVYRRDEIDASHFPAFHQMEGVKLFSEAEMNGRTDFSDKEAWLASPECDIVGKDLKATLEGLIKYVFDDPDLQTRWRDDYFPFTEPSFELDVFYQDEWLEVLGCGVIHADVLERCGLASRRGWAFGLGLERLAMVLFTIPDIRLFWTDDERFTKQFKAGQIKKFDPYSKYPECKKDIAFWIPDDFEPNDFFEIGREVCGELVESMELIDEFTNPKKGKTSHCYRINYRSMDRSLTNEEVNTMQEKLRERAAEALGCELR